MWDYEELILQIPVSDRGRGLRSRILRDGKKDSPGRAFVRDTRGLTGLSHPAISGYISLPMSKFLLPLSEFNRIYQVAHGVLQGVPGATAEKACLFFAAFGGYVLNQQYKIRTRVVGGTFAFCLGDASEVAIFGKLENGQLVSGPDAFHMWLVTETHIIDFMAPIYREAFADRPMPTSLPRKMMQRRLEEEAASLDAFTRAGDFRYFPDPDLTDRLLDNFLGRPMNADLIQVAAAWYGNRRARQAPTFAMSDEKGGTTRLSLATTVASGAW